MEKKVFLESLLVRWGEPLPDYSAAPLAGAQIELKTYVLDEDGTRISATVDQPIAVAVAAQSGYPLDDVLRQVELGALLHAETATADLAKRETEFAEQMKALREGHTSALAALADRHASEMTEKNGAIANLTSRLVGTEEQVRAKDVRIAELELRVVELESYTILGS